MPDLDVPWRQVDYCVVDVETTGLDLRHDTLVSFGSVLVRSGRIVLRSRVNIDIRPDRRIGVSAMTVHGLRHEDLETAPPLADVAGRIVSELDGRVLVAHAAWIERAIPREPVRLAGRRWRPAVVDTAALLRATGVATSGTGHEPDLEWSAETLGLAPQHPPRLGDALTTAEVLLVLAARLEQDQPGLTARSLVKISRAHPSRDLGSGAMSTRARPRVVVAGLGDSGLLTATHLARHVDVVGISTKPALVGGRELGFATDPSRDVGARLLRGVRPLPPPRPGADRARHHHRRRPRRPRPTCDRRRRPLGPRAVRRPGDLDRRHQRLLAPAGPAVRRRHRHRPARRARAAGPAGSVTVVGGGAAAVNSAANLASTWPDKRVDLYFPGERPLPTTTAACGVGSSAA